MNLNIMKKSILFLVLSLFLTISGWAINPSNLISKSVESKNLGNPEDTVPEFKLGAVNFITDNSGSAEYKNGWIRNKIQWCLYRSFNNGPLLIKADEGYWIKDVTFTYVEQADGMLADKPGESQSSIAAYASGKAIAINATERQFYVGKKTTGNGGYLTITKFAVTYCKRPTALSLQDMTLFVGDEFQLTPDVQPADADTIYSWSSDNSDVVSVNNIGVISAKAEGTATITVSAGSLSATCLLTVETDSSISVKETFSNCSVEKNFEGTTKIVGDSGIYNWYATYYQRQLAGTDDQIAGEQGLRVRYSGTLSMDGAQEGGIKAIAFNWRTTNSSMIVNHNVNVGEQHYEYNSDAVNASTVFRFSRHFEVKENAQFSFDMAAKIGEKGQCYNIVGPITITPYLLYTMPNHRAVMSADSMGTYDLTQSLINNTGEQPVFSVTGNTTGATTEIVDGVLYITHKTQTGEITIKASWKQDSVFTTMVLKVDNLPELFFEKDTMAVNLSDTPFVNPLYAPEGIGAVTYSSSNSTIAAVTSEGVVTPMGVGEALITAHVAASALYGPSSKSYVVVVSYQPAPGGYITETFSNCSATKVFDGRVHVIGDNGIYDWSIKNFQRLSDEDMIGEQQGIRIRYNGSIASSGVQEGGVRELAFDWRITGKDMPVHFLLQVGGQTYDYSSPAVPTSEIKHYIRPCGITSNTSIKLSVPAEEDPAQTYVIFSPLIITPYLLFTVPDHADTLRMADTTMYDLHEVLIDNTDSIGEITYEIVSDETGVATLEGSVIHMGEVETSGAVLVQAAWEDVTTTMTLWVEAADPSGLETTPYTLHPTPYTKVIKDGQIFICRDGEIFTVLGNTIQ